MPFDLRITFTGLCLFAPHKSDGRVHVVLAEHRPHPHVPCLVYDKEYAKPGSGGPQGDLACKKLEGCVLKLEGFSHPLYSALPKQIVDLDDVAKVGKLDPRYVRPRPGAGVSARVTMNTGGVTDWAEGLLWMVPGEPLNLWPREITHCVEWTIRVDGDRVDQWQLVGLDDDAPKPGLDTLYPIGNVVRVWIYNVPERDLPPPDSHDLPKPGDPAEHFSGYFGVLGKPGFRPIVHRASPLVDCSPLPMVKSDCKPGGLDASARVQDAHAALARPLLPKAPHTMRCIMAQVAV